MPYYMFQGSYTPAAWAGMLKKPQHRLKAIQGAVKKLGGSVEGGWLTFGEYDYVIICRLPNQVSAAAFAVAVAAGGAVGSGKTTPLLTFEEGLKAMRQAGRSGYRPPR
jgi:uncharacterized protein with GYD domain